MAPSPRQSRPAARRPLRIALLASWRFPIAEPFAGGVESHLWHLGRALVARGHDVTLLARAGSDPAAATRLVTFDEGWAPSDAARRDVSMPEESALLEHHAYLEALGQTDLFDVDLVHNHAYHYLPMTLGARSAVPWLTTLHTPPTPWLESAMAARRGHDMRFAAVSAFAAAQWDRLPTPATVVPNGVDPACWPAGAGGDGLVWTGRITPEKAPHLAIEAARRTGRHLVLAGPVSNHTYFEEMVRPRLGRHADFVGHLRQPELARLIGDSAAALITPVWDEPFGQVAAEALMCGTPVAALARGGLPEVLGDLGAPHLAPPINPRDDQNLLDAALDELARAVEAASSADRSLVRRDATRRLGLATMVARYESLYAEATTRQAPPEPPVTVIRPTGGALGTLEQIRPGS